MNISLNLTGNPAITVLTPFIKINYGDFSAKFVLSATSNAILSLAYVHFTKKEKNQRQYIEIYPLAVEISLEQVEINVPKQLTMYVGGKSYFLEVKLSENINNEINVKVNTSNSNLTIIGSSELKFNSSNPNQNFRVSLKNGSNSTATYSIGYSISGVYNKLFTLSSDSTNVKVVTTKENLTSENITFSATITIQTRSINLIIKKIKNPSFIYYQVYKRLSSESLELSDLDLINKLDNQSNEKIIETNMTTGILFCEDITSTASCKVAITNLEFKQYYVKCFAISLSGIKSSTNFTMLFQPYRNLLVSTITK